MFNRRKHEISSARNIESGEQRGVNNLKQYIYGLPPKTLVNKK